MFLKISIYIFKNNLHPILRTNPKVTGESDLRPAVLFPPILSSGTEVQWKE